MKHILIYFKSIEALTVRRHLTVKLLNDKSKTWKCHFSENFISFVS